MTALLIGIALLVLLDLAALVRNLRTDRPARPPRSAADWGSPGDPFPSAATAGGTGRLA
jgi:hypothetical protein